MLNLRVPVQVKIVLTEETKAQITGEINQAIQGIQRELDQIDFQSRKALQDAEKNGPQAMNAVQARINQEVGMRMERREQMMQQLVQIQQSPIGSEIPGGQIDTHAEVRVGDVWEDIVNGTEIVLKDGVVAEIRRAGDGA
ncbi:YlqD family protein [Tumebacillus algifaecis]|uniref:YlqD family protein n=1 Tax=Tumebacillus algifaecis TaxID=1214604 RepID=UPI0012FD3482|nr:YlqD family protein [Tumebacillus algifaecis]